MSESLRRIQQIQAAIRDVLLKEWDPIGITAVPEAHHEYDGYVAEISKFVIREASQQEIFAHLWKIETNCMGMVGDRKNTETTAKRLFEMGKDAAAK